MKEIRIVITTYVLTEVIVDSRKKSSIKDPSTGAYIEVDIYLPRLKLGFEFQVSSSTFLIILCSLQSSFVLLIFLTD